VDLFSCPGLVEREEASPPELITPLGTIAFYARIGKRYSAASASTREWRGERIRGFEWKMRTVHVELLISPFDPGLPEHLRVDEAWAVVWRFRATKRIKAPIFSCRWKGRPAWTDWTPATGQLLEAAEWSNETIDLAIGTGDAEYYTGWSGRVPWLPMSWARPFWEDLGEDFHLVDYEANEIHLSLPAVSMDELCQAHFLVAWRRDDDAQPLGSDSRTAASVAPWFAVEQEPEIFLKAAAGGASPSSTTRP
jgi:hypothetical protein